jgi:acetate kinase
MKNILVINCGSSSLKYQLFAVEESTKQFNVIAKGNAERIGQANSFVKHSHDGEKQKIEEFFPTHKEVLDKIISLLGDVKVDAVGHRVVHGGEDFASSVKITDSVLESIDKNTPLAPLHNPANILGIEASKKALSNAEQVAVFDTAFHQTMPCENYLYAVPQEWYKEHKVRRYGFHGTSHLYVSKRAAKMLNKDEKDLNIVTLHLGSGASVTAIRNGVSIDTSMGMTPMSGVVMSTRSGTIDSGIIFYLNEQKGMSISAINQALNKKSGLLGLTGMNDNRDILEAKENGSQVCIDAFFIEVNRVVKFIGSYMALIGKPIDAIVFTGGVGERSNRHRKAILQGLSHMGFELNETENDRVANDFVEEAEITTPESRIKALVIPTDEERVIAEDTFAILNESYNPDHLKMDYGFKK